MEFFDAPVVCQRCGGGGTTNRGTALCSPCKGTGITVEKRPIPIQDCTACFGKGYVIETVDLPDERVEHRTYPCTNCKGKR